MALKRPGAHADGALVIELHRIHGAGTIVVNADLVESIEATPDTVVTLVTKRRFIVADSVEDIVARTIAYRAAIARGAYANEDSTVGQRAALVIAEQEQAA